MKNEREKSKERKSNEKVQEKILMWDGDLKYRNGGKREKAKK